MFGRPISNLRFVDTIDLMGGTSSALLDLTNRLYERTRVWMDVSTEKSKIIVSARTTLLRISS
ncbi:hypothetical protein DPMN_075201 [Dreissena polymorpha]|uniref:Uncharacterized protein n=1 Tax=Dreissena polymorpha TaxID=45954 RepID=A0A9D3YGM0_DREPO|nr:hypothetical protein DPMN_075201 [Dreissena polymorpha]